MSFDRDSVWASESDAEWEDRLDSDEGELLLTDESSETSLYESESFEPGENESRWFEGEGEYEDLPGDVRHGARMGELTYEDESSGFESPATEAWAAESGEWESSESLGREPSAIAGLELEDSEWEVAPPLALEADPGTLRDRIVAVANREYEIWRRGGLKETDDAAIPHLTRYHKVGVKVDVTPAQLKSKAWHNDHPWSAVFISYVMREAGAGGAFSYARAHAAYMCAAKKARAATDNASFWAFSRTEARPEVGDLVCKDRKWRPEGHPNGTPLPCFGTTYESVCQGGKTHSDVVVEVDRARNVIYVVGGNVNQNVDRKEVRLGADGFLPERGSDGCRWLGVMKPPASTLVTAPPPATVNTVATAGSGFGSLLSMLPSVLAGAVQRGLVGLQVALAIVSGQRDSNVLTNLIFYARHPELPPGYKIKGNEQTFVREWKDIRDRIVVPLLARLPA